jgi:Na+/H+ antiporter NhaD/arsenite permease-like protein
MPPPNVKGWRERKGGSGDQTFVNAWGTGMGWIRAGAPVLLAAAGLAVTGQCAMAAPPGVDAASMSAWWIVPFVGILLSIALFPLMAPHFWHKRYGLVSLFWGLALLIPFTIQFGLPAAADSLAHTMLTEYIPFIILIGTLFTVSGGIFLKGNLHGGPRLNTTIMVIGMVLASFAGTTGASMILIRPLIRANDDRRHNAHVFVFYIFLVSNIGGALTPIGDPPLFLGYLQGVRFLWPLENLWLKTLFVAAIVLAVFFIIDLYLYRREGRVRPDPTPDARISLEGLVNLVLLGGVIAAVAFSGSVDMGRTTVLGVDLSIAGLIRDGVLIVITLASLALTPKTVREQNEYSWGPAIEVAKLFAAIFVTIIPVLAILRAGQAGSFGPLFTLLGTDAPNPLAYFWLTGTLSSFLDNAPTYLVFYYAAGGDAQVLMGPLAQTLAAISAGAVFMGAMTYIGNAPNFMVKAIAESRGIKMPSFFGYMAWSFAILLPVFVALSLLFFR